MDMNETFAGSRPLTPPAAVIYPDRFMPGRAARIAALLLNRHSATEIGQAIEILLDAMEFMDGDSDVEDNPDFGPRADGQPGTPDDTESSGDAEAGAYAEWTTLGPQQRRAVTSVCNSCGDENDELAGDETDGNSAEDEVCAYFAHMKNGPGCTVSDSDNGHNDDGG